ncbi:MAG: hypothetical protein K8T91_20170 [Planctomycetes bacterium]|nr:hypothetical protein [Planctomycetota bacterium]
MNAINMRGSNVGWVLAPTPRLVGASTHPTIVAFGVLAIILLSLSTTTAWAVDGDTLRRQQSAQQQAQQIARELVVTTLDLQIRQLEDNRLTQDNPLYDEIRRMRSSVDGLLQKEMGSVVALLVEARNLQGKQQEAKFNEAREQVRGIVMKLADERNKLRRRMRFARLAVEAQHILELQRKTYDVTLELQKVTDQDERETKALQAIQDQRDVRMLFLQMQDLLREVSGWGPPTGPAAVRGMQMVKVHRLEERLRSAVEELEHVRFPRAAEEQQAVIDGLLAVLSRVDAARPVGTVDRDTLLRWIIELKERQTRLKADTAKGELNPTSVSNLVRQEQSIHQGLGRLADELASVQAVEPPLRQSKAAAVQAITELRAARQQPAIAQQQIVIDQLGLLEKMVQDAALAAGSGKTARELTDLVGQLRDLQQKLDALRQQQTQAEQLVGQNLPAASALEKQITAGLNEQRARSAVWPTGVAAWLDQAAAATEEASLETRPAHAPARVAQAGAALDRARAEVAAALADAERTSLAVTVGELNRAVEVLERAAANERRQAQWARQAATKDGLSAKDAKAMAGEQQKIDQLSEKIGQAVQGVADDAGESLRTARASVAQTTAELNRAAALQPKTDDARKSAGQVASSADEAAKKLVESADLLRRRLRAAAGDLEKVAASQLAAVTAVERKVSRDLADANTPLAARLAQLDEAGNQVRAASVEQLRAEGREEAAEAKALEDKINSLRAAQAAAEAEARRLAEGVANSPLEAAERQQAAADAIAELANKSASRPAAAAATAQGRPDAVQAALKRAAEAAKAAAEQTVDGGPAATESLRQQAREALDEAQRAVQAEETAAEAKAAAPLDTKAQDRVTDIADTTREMIAPAAPDAAEALREAADQSAAASQKAKAGDKPAAQKKQQGTKAALAKAKGEIDAARKKIVDEAQKQLQESGEKSQQLAAEADQVAPAAGSALRAAKKASQEKSQEQPGVLAHTDEVREADEAQRKALDAARSELANRKQQIQRDKQLATDLAEKSEKEQQARNELTELSQQLAKSNPQQQKSPIGPSNPPGPEGGSPMSPQAPNPQTPKNPVPQKPSPPSPGNQSQPKQKPDKPFDPLDTSKKLTNALLDYADAQQALGEDAEKLAKQKEIKNQPLRDALELAKKLGEDLPKAKPEEFVPTDQPLFPPSNKPPLPEQKSTGGVVPKQGKQDPESASVPKEIPPQTQGPQNPASTQESPPITPNPQEQLPADMGPMASQTVQTAPITSAPQQATPPSAADVFQPNEGKPKSATPTSRATPPMGQKQNKPAAKPMAPMDPMAMDKDKKKKKIKYLPSEEEEQKPLGTGFKPETPLETAKQIAGPEALEEAMEELTKEEEQLAAKDPEMKEQMGEEEVEEVVMMRSPMAPMEPMEAPGMTGTTPGDLGMGQGTPGKGVGGDSSSPPTEQRPQKGDQHGKFDGRDIDAAAPPITPEGKPPGAAPPPPKPNKPPKPMGDPPPDEIPGMAPEASPHIMPEIGANVGAGNPPDVNPMGEFTEGAPILAAEPMAGDGEKGSKALQSQKDAEVTRKDYSKEPWFAKLPPDVQKALRSESRRPLPRGYEERLQKYFQNIE